MQEHPAVAHPSARLKPSVGWNAWLADNLVKVFGAIWTVWICMTVLLAVLLFPKGVQSVVFYLSSGWIQLWALPLINYTQNKADALRSAKADVDHQALTHMATALDEATALVSSLHARLDAMERKGGSA
jgi:hypothetical protein